MDENTATVLATGLIFGALAVVGIFLVHTCSTEKTLRMQRCVEAGGEWHATGNCLRPKH